MLAIVQARLGSNRLPRKALKIVNGKPILLWQIDRIRRSKQISRLVVATTSETIDNQLANTLSDYGLEVFRGCELDVLQRFIQVLDKVGSPEFVRLTGDCPMFMPNLCDEMIAEFINLRPDYLSNTILPTFPDGCDIEIVKAEALRIVGADKKDLKEREHVTLGIYSRPDRFSCQNYVNYRDDSKHRWTLDTSLDLQFIEEVYHYFRGREETFNYEEVMIAIDSGAISPHIDPGNLRNSALKGS